MLHANNTGEMAPENTVIHNLHYGEEEKKIHLMCKIGRWTNLFTKRFFIHQKKNQKIKVRALLRDQCGSDYSRSTIV